MSSGKHGRFTEGLSSTGNCEFLRTLFWPSPPHRLSLSTSLKQQIRSGRWFQSTLFPYSYRRGCRYDLRLTTPPELQDRYVCDSIVLRDAKHAFQPWMWNACNILLDRAFLGGHFPRSAKDLTSDRENAMKLAVTFFRTGHWWNIHRPTETLRSSPCMIQLRQTLREAPKAPAPRSRTWGTTVEGLDFIRAGTCEYYDWNAEYLERVFTAARGVVVELGVGDEGWGSARWEVHDKVRLAAFILSASTCLTRIVDY